MDSPEPPDTAPDQKLVKWIPIVVPLLALFLLLVVLVIGADVL